MHNIVSEVCKVIPVVYFESADTALDLKAQTHISTRLCVCEGLTYLYFSVPSELESFFCQV